MRVRLLKGYQGNSAGSVVDWGRGVAELLIVRRIAEPAEDDTRATSGNRPPDKRRPKG